MSKLIIDIETVGEDFNSIDKETQNILTKWLEKESYDEDDYKLALDEIKNGLGFSPYTGQIVVIGVLDADKNQGVIYFQAPGQKMAEFEENGFKFKAMSEKEMLENFWRGLEKYDECITFNGRGFDAPFLMIRSAIYQIRPSKNLMSNRYLNSQFDIKHVDLFDQLSFYGAMRRKGSLHLCCRAFGIKSPKTSGVTGDEVGPLFKQGKYLDIARYNVGDLIATRDLYNAWHKYLRF